MCPPFDEFDRSRLKRRPLASRRHDLSLDTVLALDPTAIRHSELVQVADRIITAHRKGAGVILMIGAHVIRAGVQRYLIDLMQRGLISCIATNGAGAIHDFELALIGATTESVARYIQQGRFGLWHETGRINDIVTQAARNGQGLGEAVGAAICRENLPYKHVSIFAAAYELGIPLTVHVGIGYDIVHQHPNCDGAAYGRTSYTDFLRFAHAMASLENGVAMNFGSAVMGPEIFLKALAMVRNVADQQRRQIARFTTLVCDLIALPPNYHREPAKDDPAYYFRPWKTMLVRTVAEGGRSFYVRDHHRNTIPQLWSALSATASSGDDS